MEPVTLAGISFWPDLWKPQQNLRELRRHIRDAAEQGAQVIATPEGVLDGYITRDLPKNRISPDFRDTRGYGTRVERFRKRQIALADRIGDRCIPKLREDAADLGVYLFVNTLDHRRGKQVYNTTFVIDPSGEIVGTYDKIHATFEVVNTLGKAYPVFETPYGPFGVLICADRQYPESARSVALGGARILIINSYGMSGEGANERFIRQRAYENGLFVLFCHPGESVLVSPEGRIIASNCKWEPVMVRQINLNTAPLSGPFGSKEMAETYTLDVQSYERFRKGRAQAKKGSQKGQKTVTGRKASKK